ncbi:dihydropteroate synthase [Pelagicoccus mobilis]|uniref:Dihydropteroate synthase n=1 Tax=Pelagicoccus mobilis TaxID=415221 RepID=A0A934S1E0_9BACT|nr:dihydropteroate synthase [Pelagicoccus mobilis]MBK1879239.1 dihydropteroate synthase [Pelagicoccus mobilis]
MSAKRTWRIRDGELEFGNRSLIVGILNVTPDSFSDGGIHCDRDSAAAKAIAMLEEGAGVIDLGGESTRPGYDPVDDEEEVKRTEPVVSAVIEQRADCIFSIDTTKPRVAEAALKAGARIVNDVCGFQTSPELAEVSAQFGAGVILMRNGRDGETDGCVLDRIKKSWERSLTIAKAIGVADESIVLDPGVGFGTTRQEDLEILRGLSELVSFGYPVMLGSSRKRITAQPAGLPLQERLEPTLATTVAGVAAGVDFFRVHDVAENVRAVGLTDLIYRGGHLDE